MHVAKVESLEGCFSSTEFRGQTSTLVKSTMTIIVFFLNIGRSLKQQEPFIQIHKTFIQDISNIVGHSRPFQNIIGH